MKSADFLCVGRHNFFAAGSLLKKRFPQLVSTVQDYFPIEPFQNIFTRYIDYLCLLRRDFATGFVHDDSRLFFVLWGLSAADLTDSEKSRLLSAFSGHAFLPCEYAAFDLFHFSLSELSACVQRNKPEKILFYVNSKVIADEQKGAVAFFKVNPEIWVLQKTLHCPMELLLNEEQFLSIMEMSDPAFLNCFSKIRLFRFSEKTAVIAEQSLRKILSCELEFELIPADALLPSVWYPEVLPGFICGSYSMLVLDFFALRLQKIMRVAADYDIFSFPGGWHLYGDGSEKKGSGAEFMPAPVFMLDLADVTGLSKRLEDYFKQKFPEFERQKGLNGFMEYLVTLKKTLDFLELEFVDFAVFEELCS